MLNTVYTPQPALLSLPAYKMMGGGEAPIAQTPSASPSPSTVVTISDEARRQLKTNSVAPSLTKYSPDGGNVDLSADIELTFSEAVKRGSGTAMLRKASGEVVEFFDSANSSRITFSGKTLKINPTNDLERGEDYYVTIGEGSVTGLAGNSIKKSVNSNVISTTVSAATIIAAKTQPVTPAPAPMFTTTPITPTTVMRSISRSTIRATSPT